MFRKAFQCSEKNISPSVELRVDFILNHSSGSWGTCPASKQDACPKPLLRQEGKMASPLTTATRNANLQLKLPFLFPKSSALLHSFLILAFKEGKMRKTHFP